MDSSSMKAARPLVLRPLPLALCLAFATGGSARLHAETQAVDAGEARALREVREVRDAGSAPEAAALPGVTVRASAVTGTGVDKLGQSLREIAQSVTVIGQERMREQNLYSLDDVMQNAPGVTVQPFQLLTTGYYQRGFKIDSFQQDGVPILMGNTASPRMDMAMYERVEIVRGAAGLLHGTGNPAATVNLVPKRPTREFAGSAGLTLGSWGRRRAEADVGGPLNASGSLRARVVATQEERDFFYDVAGERTGNLYAIAELDLAHGTTVHAGVHHQRIRSTTNMAGVPFYADGRDVGLPRSTYLDAAWDRFDWNTTRSFAGIEHAWGNGWQARLNLNHLSGDSELLYAGANGAVNPSTGDSRVRPTASMTARPASMPLPAARCSCGGARTSCWPASTTSARAARNGPPPSSICRKARSMSGTGIRTACRSPWSAAIPRAAPPRRGRAACTAWRGCS